MCSWQNALDGSHETFQTLIQVVGKILPNSDVPNLQLFSLGTGSPASLAQLSLAGQPFTFGQYGYTDSNGNSYILEAGASGKTDKVAINHLRQFSVQLLAQVTMSSLPGAGLH